MLFCRWTESTRIKTVMTGKSGVKIWSFVRETNREINWGVTVKLKVQGSENKKKSFTMSFVNL